MSERVLEQIFVGSAVAVVTAVVNQTVAGTIDIWWVVGGFISAVIVYGLWQGLGSFPFTTYRVAYGPENRRTLLLNPDPAYDANLREGKLLFFARLPAEGRHSHVVFGPYLAKPLRMGKYCARFTLKIDDTTEGIVPVIDIDVVSAAPWRGAKVLVRRTVSAHDFISNDVYTNFDLDFFVREDERDVEFRVLTHNSGRLITFDNVRLSRRLF